jgi:hypothetical protein
MLVVLPLVGCVPAPSPLGARLECTNVAVGSDLAIHIGLNGRVDFRVESNNAVGDVKYTFYVSNQIIPQDAKLNTFSWTSNNAGNYQFKVVAEDDLGRLAEDSVIVIVGPGAENPGCTVNCGGGGQTSVTFDRSKLVLTGCVLSGDGIQADVNTTFTVDASACMTNASAIRWVLDGLVIAEGPFLNWYFSTAGSRTLSCEGWGGSRWFPFPVACLITLPPGPSCNTAGLYGHIKLRASNGIFGDGDLNWQPEQTGGTVDVVVHWDIGPSVTAAKFTQGPAQLLNLGWLPVRTGEMLTDERVLTLPVGRYPVALTVYCGTVPKDGDSRIINIQERPCSGTNCGGGEPTCVITCPTTITKGVAFNCSYTLTNGTMSSCARGSSPAFGGWDGNDSWDGSSRSFTCTSGPGVYDIWVTITCTNGKVVTTHFTCTVVDGGGTSTLTVKITSPANNSTLPVSTTSATGTSFTATITGGQPPFRAQWGMYNGDNLFFDVPDRSYTQKLALPDTTSPDPTKYAEMFLRITSHDGQVATDWLNIRVR